MIKDLSEAIYYCTITDAMEKSEEHQKEEVRTINYYTSPLNPPMLGKVYPDYYRDLEREGGYMYYPTGNGGNMSNTPGGNSNSNNNSNGMQNGGRSTNYYT